MDDLYHLPGFLGTESLFGADLTLVLILFSSLLFTIGWQLALKKRYEIHRWVQTAAAIINAAVVIFVMLGSFWGYVLPEVPEKIGHPAVWVSMIHGLVGMAGFLLGIFIVLRANNLVPKFLQFKNYKTFMRVSYALYLLSTVFGLAVYFALYVFESGL